MYQFTNQLVYVSRSPICILVDLLYLKLPVYIHKYHYGEYMYADWTIKFVIVFLVDLWGVYSNTLVYRGSHS